MTVFVCFRRPECIFTEVNRAFQKLFLRFAFKIEVSIDTTDIWKAYGSECLNTFSVKLTVFSIKFPTKIKVLIDITPYGKLMEADGCSHKLNP